MGETRFDEAFARVEALMAEWRLEDATRVLEALKAAGSYPNRLRHDLSVLYAQQGFFHEALAEIEAAIEAEPDNRALWHHYLAIRKNDPRQPTAREWRAMHLAFGDTLRDRHDERHLAVARPEGRRLRVGLLCPDTHLATERFVWPLLEHLDPGAFEVLAYWAHSAELERFRREYPRAIHRSLHALDDAAVVSALLADAIDIAVDIAGHGAANVLTALARRPAPVAVTWLDYLATTGMEEIDFRITDRVADPPGAEEAHVERLIHLDVPQWCYRPPVAIREAPVVARTARDAKVFGAISVPLKLSDPLLDMWARLLEHVPGSRLRFLGIPDGRARTRIVKRFEDAGVDSGRIELLPRLDPVAFVQALADLDVVLDTHPFSGATSTLDALWQGVPVVTLEGPLSHGRSSACILAALGRAEWVADTPDRFVEIAARLAGDPPRLDRERQALRPALAASALCDGRAFAREMERAFAAAWESRPRGRVAANREAADFWQGLRSSSAPPREQVALDRVARVIDLALGGATLATGVGEPEWVLVTHGAHFDLATLPRTVPAEWLARFDVLCAMGADALVNGELAAAGQGHASGVRMVAEGERLYVSAWPPERMGRCAALAGGALLVRATLAASLATLTGAADAADFRRHVTRVSHQLFRSGARLGVLARLAVAERAWPAATTEWAARRALERDLALPRWGQEEPSARPMKAAFPRSAWESIAPALDERCRGPGG